jgi:hypothetical protein
LRELADLEVVRGRAAPMAGTSLLNESIQDAPAVEDGSAGAAPGTTPPDMPTDAGTSPTQAAG